MEKVRPIFWKSLAIAIAIYVFGCSVMIAELYYKVIRMEHKMMHMVQGEESCVTAEIR